MSVGASGEAFNTKKNAVTVEPGRHTVVKVLPSRMAATEDLRSIGVDRRGCRFPDEAADGGASLTAEYSQAGCQFEYMLNYSREVLLPCHEYINNPVQPI